MLFEKKMNDAQTYRLSHLSILLTQTFQTIAQDNISHQMEQHDISSNFTEDRLVEVFQTLLNDEREKLIHQTELQIKTLLKEKKEDKRQYKNNIMEKGFTIQSINAENLEIRTKVGEAQALLFGRKWKRNLMVKREDEMINKIQKKLDSYRPALIQMKSATIGFKFELNELHSELSELIYQYPSTFKKVKKKVHSRFMREFITDFSLVNNLEAKLTKKKEDCREILESMKQLYQYVTSKTPEAFSYDEVLLFQKYIKHIKSIDTKERYEHEAKKIKKKIEKYLKEKDEAYVPIIDKQKKTLEKLKKELDATCRKLRTLMSTPSVIDRSFLSQIEASKNELTTTQLKTDSIMDKLIKISFSSEPSIL